MPALTARDLATRISLRMREPDACMRGLLAKRVTLSNVSFPVYRCSAVWGRGARRVLLTTCDKILPPATEYPLAEYRLDFIPGSKCWSLDSDKSSFKSANGSKDFFSLSFKIVCFLLNDALEIDLRDNALLELVMVDFKVCFGKIDCLSIAALSSRCAFDPNRRVMCAEIECSTAVKLFSMKAQALWGPKVSCSSDLWERKSFL